MKPVIAPAEATVTDLRTGEVIPLQRVDGRLTLDLRHRPELAGVTSLKVGGVELLSPERPMPDDPYRVEPVRTPFVASPVDVEAQAAELIANVKLAERVVVVTFLRNRAVALERAAPEASRMLYGLADQVLRGDHHVRRRPEPVRRVPPPPRPPPTILAAELLDLRKRAGLSQTQLGEQLGVSRSVITHAETGRHAPAGEVLRAWRALPPKDA